MPSFLPVTTPAMGFPGRARLRLSAAWPAAGNGNGVPRSLLLMLCILTLTGGCATTTDTPAKTGTSVSAPSGSTTDTRPGPSDAYLSSIANGALSGSGNVRVQLVEGVAYVTGRCESAIDESAILRKLRGVPGVDRIENRLQRNM